MTRHQFTSRAAHIVHMCMLGLLYKHIVLHLFQCDVSHRMEITPPPVIDFRNKIKISFIFPADIDSMNGAL